MTQEQAIDILKTGANVFLTGGPGAGKTYVLNKYIKYLHNYDIDVAVTASTGIAATHIGGMTIHSWSGIGIKNHLDKRGLSSIAKSQYVAKRVRRAKVLIIEEISMLTGTTLSMVDTVCREIKENSQPFGGMQLIFAGDFFQLPPVVRREVDNGAVTLDIDNQSDRFAFSSDVWERTNPVVCYLTEQHRQDDSDYLAILSAIRSGEFDNSHLNHLQLRKVGHSQIPDNIPKLYSHNANVDRFNDDVLAKLPVKSRTYTMSAIGLSPLTVALKKGCLSPEILTLKVGAVVMFTKNNPKEKYVNGTLGTVIGFDKDDGLPIVQTRGGRNVKVEPADWTVEENGKVRAQISQLPLRLAWAITVHKSQGMNLDEAALDLSGVFEYGQGYVALSRIKRLSGLYILGWNERAFQVHPEISIKDKDFRMTSNNAEKLYARISRDEIDNKHSEFIKYCGGKKGRENAKSAVDTYSETLILWNEGKSVAQIASVRNLKEGTIFSHIEKLVRKGKIDRNDLSRVVSPSLTCLLPVINDAFNEFGCEKLAPVYTKFNGVYSYGELRIARLLFTPNINKNSNSNSNSK